MSERKFYVHWRVSGEFDTIMLARFRWYRFQIHWPVRDKSGEGVTYPLKVYNRDKLDCIYQFESLGKATGWIMETCKDLALAEFKEGELV